MGKSKIAWTDRTWNPTTGCSKVSIGCRHCYAERMWPRLNGPGRPYEGRSFTDVACHEDRLDQPLRWTKPSLVFVNSMSDLFHEDVPFEFIDKVYDVMGQATKQTFQILTKRPERALEYYKRNRDIIKPVNTSWLPNVWFGVSAENQETANERVKWMNQVPAKVRFISIEPILGPIDLTEAKYGTPDPNGMNAFGFCDGAGKETLIQWIIVGDESGPKRRPAELDWVRAIRDQCIAAQVPFMFKQWHFEGAKYELPSLDESRWDQYPEQP